MNRLTAKHYDGKGYYMICSEDCNSPLDCIHCGTLDKLVDRLAEYEDTGLTPEEIEGLKNTADQLQGLNDSLYASNQAMGKALTTWRTAKAEGRIVVLEKDSDQMSLDALALFLQNRADMTGELNEYDKMLMREASKRLAEAALKGGAANGK